MGRIDLSTTTMVILAIIVIAMVAAAVFNVASSSEDESDNIVDSLKCLPKIASACADGHITDNPVQGEPDEIDGECITVQNKDTICDTI